MYIRRLRDLREDLGLSQEKLAKLLNVSQRTYSRYETGERSIPIESLIFLADFYHTTTDYILERTDKK